MLWADPVRLQYALRKWYLTKGEEKHLDLTFNEKEGKSEVEVPLQKILSEYTLKTKLIEIYLKQGEFDLADQKIKELAQKIQPTLDKYHAKSYVGCFAFNGEDLREELEEICANIAAKDASFKYRFYPMWVPEWSWMMAFFGGDKDVLMKRLVWFKNKAKKDGKLILKDADTRFWIKERKVT